MCAMTFSGVKDKVQKAIGGLDLTDPDARRRFDEALQEESLVAIERAAARVRQTINYSKGAAPVIERVKGRQYDYFDDFGY